MAGKKKNLKLAGAVAIHGQDKEGHHVVGLGNIRVVLIPDGEFWFAQGLEIDYAVQGASIEDAQKQFQDGLLATVRQHLQAYGDIEKLLTIAPPEVWQEVGFSKDSKLYHHSQVSFHMITQQQGPIPFPFKGIEYLIAAEAAATCG